jgi:hypothetical protein
MNICSPLGDAHPGESEISFMDKESSHDRLTEEKRSCLEEESSKAGRGSELSAESPLSPQLV